MAGPDRRDDARPRRDELRQHRPAAAATWSRRLGAVAPERCLAIPGVLPEQVPAAMSIFDIAFDPAGHQPWRLGRSQLRWLEAGAWGIPLVGDPRIYPDIEDGVTGFHAADPVDVARTILRLVDDPLLRAAVGGRARRRRRGALLDGGGGAAVAARARAGGGVKVGVAGRRRSSGRAAPSSRRRSSAPRRRRASRWSTAARTSWSSSPAATCACIHNCVTYPAGDGRRAGGQARLRYWHDLARAGRARRSGARTAGRPSTRRASSPRRCIATASRTASRARRHLIPPAIDLARFRAEGRAQPRGACWLGSAMHAGKGLHPGVRVGGGERAGGLLGRRCRDRRRTRARIRAKGHVPPEYVPEILGRYERFVFLPTTVEPFGRAVVEAWAAGCELIVNRNVGALHWLEDPTGLRDGGARTSGGWSRRAGADVKILIHSNAPWSPSGYGQQVALFAPRLAEHTDLAISAFHGLANAPLNVAGLTIYPGSGAGWGNDVVQAHAERHFGSLRGGLVLSLVDVFVLDPAIWRELNAAAWVPVDHDPAPPAVLDFFAVHRRRADRHDALRAGAAAGLRPALRPARSRNRRLPAAAAGRRACRRGHPPGRVRGRHRRRQQGSPFPEVACRDDRGVRRLPGPARRRTALPAHGAPGGAPGDAPAVTTRGARCRRRGRSRRRPEPLPLPPLHPGGDGSDLRVDGRAPERIHGRRLRAHRARGAGVRRARDRHRLHRHERGLRGRLEVSATSGTGPTRAPGRRGPTSRRSSRAWRSATGSTRSRGKGSPPAPASTRSSTTPTGCWPSTGCLRSNEVAARLPGLAPPLRGS